MITQAVVAALQQITVANGYKTPGVVIVRPRRTGEGFVPQAGQVSVLQGAEERIADDGRCGNPPATEWRLSIACDLVVRLSETSPQPMDQALNIFEADVRAALMADTTLGGVAIYAELGGSDYPSSLSGFEGVTVWLNVTYRTAENDMYVNAI